MRTCTAGGRDLGVVELGEQARTDQRGDQGDDRQHDQDFQQAVAGFQRHGGARRHISRTTKPSVFWTPNHCTRLPYRDEAQGDRGECPRRRQRARLQVLLPNSTEVGAGAAASALKRWLPKERTGLNGFGPATARRLRWPGEVRQAGCALARALAASSATREAWLLACAGALALAARRRVELRDAVERRRERDRYVAAWADLTDAQQTRAVAATTQGRSGADLAQRAGAEAWRPRPDHLVACDLWLARLAIEQRFGAAAACRPPAAWPEVKVAEGLETVKMIPPAC